MFKRSRRRIVAAIMSILVLLWAGTLGVIYVSSYFEMRHRNGEMLEAHVQMYTLPQSFEQTVPPSKPKPEGDYGKNPAFDPDSPMFQLSTFYTVALSYEGEVLDIKNDSSGVHSDRALTELARRVMDGDAADGIENNLAFYKKDKGGYVLVAFMDNTVVNENAVTLFNYTLIIGGVALIVFFFLSVFLAKKIVDPLEESDQKQKQFISDAGHELKTPVAVISANAELLGRKIGSDRWLQNIQYENERMGALVEQLLALMRAESTTPQTERLDFSRLVAGEALPFESVAFEKGISLNYDVAEGIAVEGNPGQLKQIVSILLDNAICHSPGQGEVKLSLTREHKTARLSLINAGKELSAEQREKIFERFYRADDARSGNGKHYGLGLAIAKTIVTAHGGQIEVLCYNGLVEFRIHIPTVS